MTNSVLDREDAPKHFPKSNLHQKKVMVTVWSSLASLIHYSFLNPGKIITSEKYAQQINEMYWKWQHLQQVLTNRMDPILLYDNARLHITQPMLQKLNELGYDVLPHPPYSPDFSWLPFLQASQQLFVRKITSTTSRRRKMHSKSFLNPQHALLCYRNKQTYFSLAKMCWW